MVRARPARSLEGFPQGAASAVKPDRCVVGRDPQVAGHLVERLFSQLDPSHQFCMFRLQCGDHLIDTSANSLEERLIGAGGHCLGLGSHG